MPVRRVRVVGSPPVLLTGVQSILQASGLAVLILVLALARFSLVYKVDMFAPLHV